MFFVLFFFSAFIVNVLVVVISAKVVQLQVGNYVYKMWVGFIFSARGGQFPQWINVEIVNAE